MKHMKHADMPKRNWACLNTGNAPTNTNHLKHKCSMQPSPCYTNLLASQSPPCRISAPVRCMQKLPTHLAYALWVSMLKTSLLKGRQHCTPRPQDTYHDRLQPLPLGLQLLACCVAEAEARANSLPACQLPRNISSTMSA